MEGHVEANLSMAYSNQKITDTSQVANVQFDKTGPKKDRVYKDKERICPLCQKVFHSRSGYNTHIKAHSEEKARVCDVCNKQFVTSHQLKLHMRTHSAEGLYTCDTCHKTFVSDEFLKEHLVIHNGETPHVCVNCGKGFSLRSALKRHSLTHTGEAPHSCDKCGKSFKQISSLKKHMLSHTGDEFHSCEECGKGFTSSANMFAHKRRHAEETRVFKEKSNLKKHAAAYTAEGTHLCTICGKEFKHRSSLRRHMLCHTGDKPIDSEYDPEKIAVLGTEQKHNSVEALQQQVQSNKKPELQADEKHGDNFENQAVGILAELLELKPVKNNVQNCKEHIQGFEERTESFEDLSMSAQVRLLEHKSTDESDRTFVNGKPHQPGDEEKADNFENQGFSMLARLLEQRESGQTLGQENRKYEHCGDKNKNQDIRNGLLKLKKKHSRSLQDRDQINKRLKKQAFKDSPVKQTMEIPAALLKDKLVKELDLSFRNQSQDCEELGEGFEDHNKNTRAGILQNKSIKEVGRLFLKYIQNGKQPQTCEELIESIEEHHVDMRTRLQESSVVEKRGEPYIGFGEAEKQQSCGECGKNFKNVRDLQKHLLSHVGNSLIPCVICGLSFKHLPSLGSHMRTHSI